MKKYFENTEIAFALKSNSELKRAYFLFKMIANEPLVRIGTAVTNFCIKANLPVDGLIKYTVFDHFCGGVSEEDCLSKVSKMFEAGVSSILDYSVEGKEDEKHFDEAAEKIIKLISFSKNNKALPFSVFKPTGFGRFKLYEIIGEGKKLSPNEEAEWSRVEARFDKVCKAAFHNDVPVLIDAEESWMQDTADMLVEKMMEKYNKEKAIVYNTLQMYRWDRLNYLKGLHNRAKTKQFHIGMKVVRGAYMEKENERAIEKGYKSPICVSKMATDENYNNAINYMLDHIDTMAIFAGTHNEESSFMLMNLLKEKNIDINDNRIVFGQLYGMSDHITYNLAADGYNVSKYMPFGPVKDVMPYLIRRAEENTSVAGQTSRELNLLKAEKQRRKLMF
ncbi:proline dehydrogenase [Neptunitalea chrysea]|uniref:Proline dehydrogenase n=1 Tax=Neptunitalea chrysea TaxID=1647581 RepID=A0A9W6B3S8_9FLAO|nr:proline dehydrogenase family protein [Neptunitalea chrysea]GLB51984.1 proline dehydrogenase [Neptunitalea chrysea]